MDKEEILAKSRLEHRNQDMVEKELALKAGNIGAITGVILCGILCVIQICAGEGVNWGLWSVISAVQASTFAVRAYYLKSKKDMIWMICYIILTILMTGAFVVPMFTRIFSVIHM